MSRKKLTRNLFFDYQGEMPMPTSIQLDPEMKKALEKLAEEKFCSVSTLIKQSIAKLLKDEGVEWRKPQKKPKK